MLFGVCARVMRITWEACIVRGDMSTNISGVFAGVVKMC